MRYARIVALLYATASGMMEKDGLIKRAERVGIHTTSKGSALLVALMNTRYKDEAEALFGRTVSKSFVDA